MQNNLKERLYPDWVILLYPAVVMATTLLKGVHVFKGTESKIIEAITWGDFSFLVFSAAFFWIVLQYRRFILKNFMRTIGIKIFIGYAVLYFVLMIRTILVQNIFIATPAPDYYRYVAIREFMSFTFNLLGIFLSVIYFYIIPKRDVLRALAKVIIIYTAIMLMFFILEMAGLLSHDIHYYEIFRYKFLTENPNQFALYIVVLPFLTMYFYQEGYVSKKIFWILMVLLNISMIIPLSHALLCSYILSLSIIVIYYSSKFAKNKAICLAGVMLLFFVLAVWALYVISLNKSMPVPNLQEVPQKLSFRMSLLSYYIDILINSFWGHGLAGFLYDSANSYVGYIPEAHNLFLDFAVRGGGIGLLIIGLLVIYCTYQVLQSRNLFLILAFVSLLMLSQFHFLARHLLFWFYLILIVSLSFSEQIKNKCPDKCEYI